MSCKDARVRLRVKWWRTRTTSKTFNEFSIKSLNFLKTTFQVVLLIVQSIILNYWKCVRVLFLLRLSNVSMYEVKREAFAERVGWHGSQFRNARSLVPVFFDVDVQPFQILISITQYNLLKKYLLSLICQNFLKYYCYFS